MNLDTETTQESFTNSNENIQSNATSKHKTQSVQISDDSVVRVVIDQNRKHESRSARSRDITQPMGCMSSVLTNKIDNQTEQTEKYPRQTDGSSQKDAENEEHVAEGIDGRKESERGEEEWTLAIIEEERTPRINSPRSTTSSDR